MRLKIVSLNVWIGGILFEPMLDFLNDQQADIILLQEVFNGQDKNLKPQYRTYNELQTNLDIQYSHFAPAFLEDVDGQEIVQGNAIFSRFPLNEIGISHYDVPYGKRKNVREEFHLTPRSLQHVVANIRNIKLHLLNTQGIWGLDGEDNQRRLAMSDRILEEINGNSPLLLAGDFNLQPKTQTIRKIEEKLNNVFKNELKTSFNLQRKDLEKYPGFATAVVDMVFLTHNIKVIRKSCPQVDISDHLPLIATIEI